MRRFSLAGALAFGILSLGGTTAAQPPTRHCFFISEWESSKAANDHTVYLKVRGKGIYRLDLASACPELLYPGAHLVTTDRMDTICEPIDWQLKITQGGMSTACIVTGMSLLTPDQVAALPRDSRP
jgi:hypothetical protein